MAENWAHTFSECDRQRGSPVRLACLSNPNKRDACSYLGRLSYGVSHRLQRVSPDVALQYKDWNIPINVRGDHACRQTHTLLRD